uniref:Uncharacterized protein n=1 Tax=Trypanosoma vivax (strain Y486) TaxID=1055687 RepID=G0U9I1_TRYVY|nr:hypothetical protein TVY486_1117510 [Trypanosoma vivax Y486]
MSVTTSSFRSLVFLLFRFFFFFASPCVVMWFELRNQACRVNASPHFLYRIRGREEQVGWYTVQLFYYVWPATNRAVFSLITALASDILLFLLYREAIEGRRNSSCFITSPP